ncbi:MAG: hypothetical protein IPL32_18115 [Chloracidobacterium sp.]|nr:hypothetical protein [Chloracidobacterium sp.]
MLTNTAVTIYNKYIQSRAEKYQRTVIPAALWESAAAVSKRNSADLALNKALIAIPFSECRKYYSHKMWLALDAQNRATHWTLSEGDIVVRGSVADEITDSFTVSALRAKYDDVLEIASVARMDQGSPNTHHMMVGCK